MRYLLLLLTLCAAGVVSAQSLDEAQDILINLKGDDVKYVGRVILNDGSEEKGTISYNDKTAVVSFESESKSGTYNARNLSGFDFYDPFQNKQRTFFSMESEMRDGGSRTSQFFEIIRQYKNFAVIIKTDPVVVKKKIGVVEASVLGDYERRRVVVSTAMTVYFVNEDVGVRPYLQVSSKNVSHINRLVGWDFFSGESTKVRILDQDLPKELMGANYKKVVQYMKENKFRWDQKNELIATLDYFDTLADN